MIRITPETPSEASMHGRLTLQSGTAVPTSSQSAQTTVYFTPYLGNRSMLYDTTAARWYVRIFSEASVSVPATLFRLFDVFAYWTGSALALETVNWNQTTGTITGATAATPCVITSNGHGLSNGDLVGIAGIVGTLGTNASDGVNGTVWRAANVAANTFELEGSRTGGLTYTSGGTWYKIPQTRTTALTTQDGIYAKSGDTSRRYLGTGMTTGTSGQTETVFGTDDTPASWLLWNYHNRVSVELRLHDTTDSWTYTTAAYRAANGRGKLNRIGVVCGVNEEMLSAETYGAATDSSVTPGATTVTTGMDLDGFATNDAFRPSAIGGSGSVTVMIARYAEYVGIGFHFLGWLEHSDGAGAGTTTWYGDGGDPTRFKSGMMAQWRA